MSNFAPKKTPTIWSQRYIHLLIDVPAAVMILLMFNLESWVGISTNSLTGWAITLGAPAVVYLLIRPWCDRKQSELDARQRNKGN